jgi:hypothetical protein
MHQIHSRIQIEAQPRLTTVSQIGNKRFQNRSSINSGYLKKLTAVHYILRIEASQVSRGCLAANQLKLKQITHTADWTEEQAKTGTLQPDLRREKRNTSIYLDSTEDWDPITIPELP